MKFVVQLADNYLHQKIPSILISITDNRFNSRYIFNVPPAHQRFINNHKMKFQIGANYFFTKTSTQSIAGLSGMMLTMFENKCSEDSKLFVNQQMFQYLQSIRYQMGFKFMPFSYISWKGKVRKGLNSLEKIKQIRESSNYPQIMSNFSEYLQKNVQQKLINNPLHSYLPQKQYYKDEAVTIIPFFIKTKNQQITNFICIPKTVTGKLNKKKIDQLKIQGKLVGEIVKKGKIQLKDGRIITLEQIKEPDQPSEAALILHYNSVQAIEMILKNDVFVEYVKNKQNLTQLVVHIVEEKQIIQENSFKILLNLFSNDVDHLVYNRNYKNASDKFQQIIDKSPHIDFVSKISEIYPEVMPNINQNNEQFFKNHKQACMDIEDFFPNKKIHMYKQCYQFVVVPKLSVGYKKIIQAQKMHKQLLQKKEIMIPESNHKINFTEINPKVVFLGTGSMKPGLHRNVSSIFIQYTKNASIMMDCGEGSYYQLFNHYGPQKIDQILKNLRIVFITHIHADHNLGILDLIKARITLMRKLNIKEKLFLIIPYNVIPWFHNYVQKIQNLYEGCELIFIQWLRNEPLINLNEIGATICKSEKLFSKKEKQNQEGFEDEFNIFKLYRSKQQKQLQPYFNSLKNISMQNFEEYLKSLNITQFHPTPVLHCPQSFGIIIKHKSNIKISYSGDTRPIIQFAQAAKNSTLMIHESTLGDDLEKDAITNMHSTVGQAIQIGMKSNSWKLALTHFSQRYRSGKKITSPFQYKTNQQKFQYALNHTIVCFDHLQFQLCQAHKMPYISRGISQIIPDDDE